MSQTALGEQKKHLNDVIKKLESVVKKLPSDLPCGSKDGPISTHFTNRAYDAEEGPYFTFNKSWERVFQPVDLEKKHVIVRGKHGLQLVCSFIVHFSNIPEIEANNGLQLVALRAENLIEMIENL
jgi:hypothetical protein